MKADIVLDRINENHVILAYSRFQGHINVVLVTEGGVIYSILPKFNI